MASNDNVINLLDDSSDVEQGGIGMGAVAAAAPAPAVANLALASSPASRRRKRRRQHAAAAAAAPAAASNVDVFEIDDSDGDDEDGNTNGAAAAGVDDSVEILSPPTAAAAARSPGSSDGSAIEMISPFTAARQRRMNGIAIGIDDDPDAKPAAAAAAAPPTAASSKPPADTPLHRIVIIFPDICPNHAREELRRVGLNPTRIDATDGITPAEEQMISVALSNLVEGGSYPKNETLARGNAGGDGRGGMVGGSLLVASKSRPYLHDYTSMTSFVPSDVYKDEVVERLMVAFCFLSKEGVKRHLALSKGRYSVCYTRICDAIAGVDGFAFGTYGNKKKAAAAAAATSLEDDPIAEEKLHKRLRAVQAGCALTDEEIGRLRIPAPNGFTATLRRSRRNYRPADATDRVLVDEVRYASDKLAERADVVATAAERQRIHDASEKAGTTLECQCCYGDYAIEEMVSCRNEGHLFCMDCIRRYAEERVFGIGDLGSGGGGGKKSADGDDEGVAANDLTCMHPDGCKSTFQYKLLQKALPPKVMQKYDELQATRAMEIARVEGLHRCPRCDFQALLDASEMIFACPVQSCRFESCKLCGEASHIPLKCSEVEKQTETDGRKKVEEAMSEARIRTCPKEGCGNRFYKVDGCNKMTCPKCGAYSCYVCRALIPSNVSYLHFCQTAHCQHQSCGKCALYTNNHIDIQATKEAGEKAAKEIAENTNQGVNVNVDALLDKASPRRNRYPAMQAPPPPPPPPAAAAAAAGIYAGLPPGAAAAAPYYPPGLPVGIAGVPAVANYPMVGMGGPPPGLGGGGGGRRRRRRRR